MSLLKQITFFPTPSLVYSLRRQVVQTLADGGAGVAYASLLVRVSTAFRWSLSRKLRNKSAHIAHGNTARGRVAKFMCVQKLSLTMFRRCHCAIPGRRLQSPRRFPK